MRLNIGTIEFGLCRLEALATLLESLKTKLFDYNMWVDIDKWKGKASLSCGTSACALGWATTIEHRLRMVKIEGDGDVRFQHKGGQFFGMDAAVRYYGLDDDEAGSLFYPCHSCYWGENFTSPPSNATAKQVARHIRKFVKFKRKALTSA